jgi:hypothetical protein
MTHRLVRAKRLLSGLAVIAALSVAPAFAASPSVTDAGSSWSTLRINGSGFSPSTLVTTRQAYVQIENDDPSGTISYLGDTITISGPSCGFSRLSCTTGGTFHYERNMAGYQCGRRFVRAQDMATMTWSPWIQVDCA